MSPEELKAEVRRNERRASGVQEIRSSDKMVLGGRKGEHGFNCSKAPVPHDDATRGAECGLGVSLRDLQGRKARAGAQAAIRGDAAGHGPLAIEIQKRFVQFFMLSVGDGSSCRLVPLGN